MRGAAGGQEGKTGEGGPVAHCTAAVDSCSVMLEIGETGEVLCRWPAGARAPHGQIWCGPHATAAHRHQREVSGGPTC
eukprot:365010-Chlamydomonas_euryale.AAC.2